jgi:predicted  nucleic acid-binding Zn-ribbon protein
MNKAYDAHARLQDQEGGYAKEILAVAQLHQRVLVIWTAALEAERIENAHLREAFVTMEKAANEREAENANNAGLLEVIERQGVEAEAMQQRFNEVVEQRDEARYKLDQLRQIHPETVEGRFRKEVEAERMRLVACGVAAMQNTPELVKERIGPEHPYYSASYGDVCRAVDREIALRQRPCPCCGACSEDYSDATREAEMTIDEALRIAENSLPDMDEPMTPLQLGTTILTDEYRRVREDARRRREDPSLVGNIERELCAAESDLAALRQRYAEAERELAEAHAEYQATLEKLADMEERHAEAEAQTCATCRHRFVGMAPAGRPHFTYCKRTKVPVPALGTQTYVECRELGMRCGAWLASEAKAALEGDHE